MQILLSPDPVDPAAPPAAEIVIKSPRELELEQEVQTEREARLTAEHVAAEAEDKAAQLVEIDRRRPNPGLSPKAKKKIKVPGNTFFHEEEEVEVDE